MTPTSVLRLAEQLDEARLFLRDSRPAMFGPQRYAMCAELLDAGSVLSQMAELMQAEEGVINSPDFA